MGEISYHELLKKIPNKYLLSVVIAKRVKHICESPELYSKELKTEDPFHIAVKEILTDKVKIEFAESGDTMPEGGSANRFLSDEDEL
ncbi:MAG: DNA-directed RNA polymerase subunit omega [Bacteroidota bacterium]